MKMEEFEQKHGFKFKSISDSRIPESHIASLDQVVSRDPNFIKNTRLGRYMPKMNGRRIIFRGSDLVKHLLKSLLVTFLETVVYFILIGGSLILILMELVK